MTRSFRSLEALVLLLSVGAVILLVPLRDAAGELPLLRFLCALILFLVPGALLWRWSLAESLPGAAVVPVAFALSTGIFGLLGVPFLFAQTSLDAYIWASGAVLAAFLLGAAFLVLRRRRVSEDSGNESGRSFSLLWAPFLGFGGMLTYLSSMRTPGFVGDLWVYLAWVREYLNAEHLARYEPYFGHAVGVSRARVNGWLLEQAALSRVSGVDPIEMVLGYLGPVLVVVALLAFYVLARVLLKNESAALFAGCVCSLFFLVQIEPSATSFGGEFIGRITEDKYAARFVFLPVSLCAAVLFLEGRGRRFLWLFAFLCWASVAVHPVGLAILGLSMAGLAAFYVGANPRAPRSWRRVVALGAAGASVLVCAFVLVQALGEPLSSVLKDADINSGDPDVLANMVFVRPERQRIFELGNGLYIMHPVLLLNPAIIAAFVPGLPFLAVRLKRSGGADTAAQLLLGTLLVTTIVCYVPQVATFFGNNVVVPGQLHRMTWPLILAALLTVAWMGWEAVAWVRDRVEGLAAAPRWLGPAVPVMAACALVAAAATSAEAADDSLFRARESALGSISYRFDPVFAWMRDNIREPSVVMAPDEENSAIPAWSTEANVVSLRGGLVLDVLPALQKRTGGEIQVPQGALDVRDFYAGTTLEKGVRILRRHKVDYVLVFAGSGLDDALNRLTGFKPVAVPSERYSLYSVDLKTIGA